MRELGCETVHFAWDNTLPPRLEIESGETPRHTCRDTFDGAHLVTACGLTREEAYVLRSVAADLKISEVVDAPNWLVSAFLPLGLFG